MNAERIASNALQPPGRTRRPLRGGRRCAGGGGPFVAKTEDRRYSRRLDSWQALRAFAAWLGLGPKKGHI